MSSWDKMDNIVWNKSDVMQSFEKNIITAANELANKAEEHYKTAQKLKQVSQDIQSINEHAGKAATSLKQVSDAVNKMSADDGEVKESEIQSLEHEVQEESINLIQQLLELSYVIADAGDTPLAYKIERLIREIEEEHSTDELEESEESEESEEE